MKTHHCITIALTGATILLALLIAVIAFAPSIHVPDHNNARCPVCGHCFHIHYANGHIARMVRNDYCPNCRLVLPQSSFYDEHPDPSQPTVNQKFQQELIEHVNKRKRQ
jgi:hypothetical protein